MVFEILTEGAENARTGKEICGILNITMRELTAIVERERRAGAPICANTGDPPGYFFGGQQRGNAAILQQPIEKGGRNSQDPPGMHEDD